MKNKLVLLTILSFCFVFLSAFSLFDGQNVLMTKNKLIDFGRNGGDRIFNEGSNLTPAVTMPTPSPKPSASPTPILKKTEKNYRVRIRSTRIYWGIGTDKDSNPDTLLDDIEELKDLVSTKLVSGSMLYVIDDYAESKTYKAVEEVVSTSRRLYTVHFVPNYSEIVDTSEATKDNAQK